MRTRLRRCAACSEYTLEEVCPHCGSVTGNPVPARFSPEDRYGEYRLRSKMQRCDDNGRHNQRPDREA